MHWPLSSLFLLALVSGTLRAESPRVSGWHCLDEHLHEAIILNEERREAYAERTGGESLAISDALIKTERDLLKLLALLDRPLQSYWKAGVPFLCREYAPMKETPAFRETFETPLPEGSPTFVSPWRLTARLQWAYLSGGREALASKGRAEILALDKPDHYQCLVKHFLESIVSTAEHAEAVSASAVQQGKLRTDWLHAVSLHLHIASLFEAARLDRASESIHRSGVPIICNDVPIILKDLHGSIISH